MFGENTQPLDAVGGLDGVFDDEGLKHTSYDLSHSLYDLGDDVVNVGATAQHDALHSFDDHHSSGFFSEWNSGADSAPSLPIAPLSSAAKVVPLKTAAAPRIAQVKPKTPAATTPRKAPSKPTTPKPSPAKPAVASPVIVASKVSSLHGSVAALVNSVTKAASPRPVPAATVMAIPSLSTVVNANATKNLDAITAAAAIHDDVDDMSDIDGDDELAVQAYLLKQEKKAAAMAARTANAQTGAAGASSTSSSAKFNKAASTQVTPLKGPSTPRASTPSGKRKGKGEKRLKRYSPAPSYEVRQRMKGALSQRMFLLEHDVVTDGLNQRYVVLDENGMVYTVRLAQLPTCTCSDADKGCRHIMFVLLRVLRRKQDDPVIWQKALLTEELMALAVSARDALEIAKSSGGPHDDSGNSRSDIQWHELTAMTTTAPSTTTASSAGQLGDVPQRELVANETCSVCFDLLVQGANSQPTATTNTKDRARCTDLVWCRQRCGRSLHSVCAEIWTKHHGACPHCSANWSPIRNHDAVATDLADDGGIGLSRGHAHDAHDHDVHDIGVVDLEHLPAVGRAGSGHAHDDVQDHGHISLSVDDDPSDHNDVPAPSSLSAGIDMTSAPVLSSIGLPLPNLSNMSALSSGNVGSGDKRPFDGGEGDHEFGGDSMGGLVMSYGSAWSKKQRKFSHW